MSARAADPPEPAVKTGVARQLRELFAAVRASAVRRTLAALAGGIVVIVAITAYMQVELNSWNKPFSARARRAFKNGCGFFCASTAELRKSGKLGLVPADTSISTTCSIRPQISWKSASS